MYVCMYVYTHICKIYIYNIYIYINLISHKIHCVSQFKIPVTYVKHPYIFN